MPQAPAASELSPAASLPRLWVRIPIWLSLLASTLIAAGASWKLQRELARSVADELSRGLATQIEVAELLLAASANDPRKSVAEADQLGPNCKAKRFARALLRTPVMARPGRSGETYAFDRAGVMLTPSRFEDELREQDLLVIHDDTSVVELRDPGGHVAAGYRPALPRRKQPLTRAVAAAVAGHDGVDVEGYRDYRGVRVVGAWRWLPQLDVGVIVEVDAAEALSLSRGVRYALFSVYAALALALLAVGGSSRLDARARTQIETATRLGQYTLVRELGRGGMGIVYEARHALLRRPTAVKLMNVDLDDPTSAAEAVQRFEREVQLTSLLTHPNTVVIYDYGCSDEGQFYYAMEYIEGIDLDRLVRLDGPLPAARVLHFAVQICGSLTEAHAMSLIHRDIKPANILVCERGGAPDWIKVLDFGLVKSLLGPQVSAAHVLVGTPHFMAPELMREPKAADARSDIYSLGAVLYWLTTGQTVLLERARNNLSMKIALPSSLRADVPIDLERIIMRCLAHNPLERPLTMAELAAELRACRSYGSWSTADARRYWHAHAHLLPRGSVDAPAPAALAPR